MLFNYAAKLLNSICEMVPGTNFTTDTISSPTNEVYWQVLLDPGHEGTASFLEYFLQVYATLSGAGTLTATWQYKPDGGSWTDLDSQSYGASSSTSRVFKVSGVLEASIAMPVQIRLRITYTGSSVYCTFNDTTYLSAARVVGEV